MSDTPETDDEIRTPRFDFEYMGEPECVDASFAKKLERERDEARREAERFRENAIRVSKGGDNTRPITDNFSWENDQEHTPK